METLLLILTACIDIAFAPLFLMKWRKLSGARTFPFIVGFLAYLAVSFVRTPIRSGIATDDDVTFYFLQGLLTAVLEETARFIAFNFILTNFDRREDALSYGIGHAALEFFGTALMKFQLISNSDGENSLSFGIYILMKDSLLLVSGAIFHIALTLLIFYAVRNQNIAVMLPAAITIHTLINTITGIIPVTAGFVVTIAASVVLFIMAKKLYSSLPETYSEPFELSDT